MPTPSLGRAQIAFIGVHGYDERYRCLSCGEEWVAMYKTGGGFHRGGWHCPNGCNAGLTGHQVTP